MNRNQTLGGFLKNFIAKHLLYSEQFINYHRPLVTCNTYIKGYKDFQDNYFNNMYSPYEFYYSNLQDIKKQPKQYKQNPVIQKMIMFQPLGLIGIKQKRNENDFKQVQSTSFVHSMELVTDEVKMDDFSLDEVETVQSEYEEYPNKDEEFLDSQNTLSSMFSYNNTKNSGNSMTASASF